MQRLDHQCAARHKQVIHCRQQRDDVLVQQRKVGTNEVIAFAHVNLALGQLCVAGQVHLGGAHSTCGIHQSPVTIDAHSLDSTVVQRAQQPALATAQVKYPFGLTAEDGQQNGLVSDLPAALDGAAAHGIDPGLGVVLPTVEQGAFRVRHGGVPVVELALC